MSAAAPVMIRAYGVPVSGRDAELDRVEARWIVCEREEDASPGPAFENVKDGL